MSQLSPSVATCSSACPSQSLSRLSQSSAVTVLRRALLSSQSMPAQAGPRPKVSPSPSWQKSAGAQVSVEGEVGIIAGAQAKPAGQSVTQAWVQMLRSGMTRQRPEAHWESTSQGSPKAAPVGVVSGSPLPSASPLPSGSTAVSSVLVSAVPVSLPVSSQPTPVKRLHSVLVSVPASVPVSSLEQAEASARVARRRGRRRAEARTIMVTPKDGRGRPAQKLRRIQCQSYLR